MMFCNGANEVWLATGCMSIMYSFYYYKTNTGALLTVLGLVSSFLLYLLMRLILLSCPKLLNHSRLSLF
jgi:uncharacterized membrane protein